MLRKKTVVVLLATAFTIAVFVQKYPEHINYLVKEFVEFLKQKKWAILILTLVQMIFYYWRRREEE